MTAKSHSRGHPILWAYGAWRYECNGKVDDGSMPCRKCGMKAEPGEPDPCMGWLPGVSSACCGHGDRSRLFIKFNDGTVVRGTPEVEEST